MDYKNGKFYCIYNYVNSEVYVGSTCSSLSKRMSEHRNNARTSTKMRHYALYESMREHGFDTHTILNCMNSILVKRKWNCIDVKVK